MSVLEIHFAKRMVAGVFWSLLDNLTCIGTQKEVNLRVVIRHSLIYWIKLPRCNQGLVPFEILLITYGNVWLGGFAHNDFIMFFYCNMGTTVHYLYSFRYYSLFLLQGWVISVLKLLME